MIPVRVTVLGLALVASLAIAVSATQAAPSGGCVVIVSTTTCTFNFTDAPEAWVVPAGVNSAVFDVFGAQGGNYPAGGVPGGVGGHGAHVQATLALTPGETLN